MKRLISLFAFLAIFVVNLNGCSYKQNNDDKTVLILANLQKEDYPTSVACDKFAQLVNKKTNGKVVIETYHNGQLGEEDSVVNQVKAGVIDFARVSTSALTKFDDNLNAFQFPFIFKDENSMWKVLESDLGDKFLNSSSLKQNGVEGLTWYTGGSRNFYNSKKEIKNADDLKGMKIRVQSTDGMNALIKSMGAEPVSVAFSDLYSSIENGDIDGAENNWPSYISTDNYKVAKYITVDQHTAIPEMIIVSNRTMAQLSDEDQKIIRECAVESTKTQKEVWNKYEKDSMKTAENAGCVITYLNDDQSSSFKKIGSDVSNKQGAKYKDVLKQIKDMQ